MKLKVIGSSSKGNCYLLSGDKDSVLIECGLRINKIKEALNFDFSKVAGCLVSHEHKDHSLSINQLLIAGIPVFTSRGTASDLNHHNLNIIQSKQPFDLGEFRILPFDTIHDATEPLGFLIEQKSTGERLLFATDTYYIKYQFKGLNYLLIEANHSNEILEDKLFNGKIHPSLKSRVQTSHLSIETLRLFLSENDISKVKKIVLIHLSDSNSDTKGFKETIESQTGIETIIAEPGIEINLELYPF